MSCYNLHIMSEIRKNRKNKKLFVLITSTNFYLIQFLIKCIFSISIIKNTIKIKKLHFLNKICEMLKNIEMENYLPK